MENIVEKTIDYGDEPNRMEKGIENSINKGTHHLAKNPAFPDSGGKDTFDQLMASKRFRDVIERLRYYTKSKEKVVDMYQVQMILLKTYQTVLKVEAQHKEQLEQLAVKLVKVEFNLTDEDLNFNADITGEDEQPDLSDIDITPKDAKKLANLDLEVQKRKFINSLIQGAAVKTTYAFNLVKNELEKIKPGLTDMYSIMAILSEFGYWMVPDQLANQMAQQASVGKVKVNFDEETPTVEAKGTIFPFLVHELVKGVMEALTSHSQLSDEEREYVIKQADALGMEHMGLRLGPAFWEKLNDTIFDAKVEKYKNNIISYISHLKAEEFNKVMKDVLSDNKDAGIKRLQQIGKEIEIDLRNNNRQSLTESIIDESLSTAKERYLGKEIDEETFKQLIELDPTAKRNKFKYIDFICKSFVEGATMDEIRNKVTEFDDLSNRNLVDKEKKDITKYKTFKEFSEYVDSMNNVKSKTNIEKEIKKGADIIIDNADMFIVAPRTHEASCIYGAGTKWCTTMTTNTHWQRYYYSDNVTFYYITIRSEAIKKKLRNKNLEKVAIVVFADGRRMDAYDAADDQIDAKKYLAKIGLNM